MATTELDDVIIPESTTIAKITCDEDCHTVVLRSPKNDTVRAVAKSHGYAWNGCTESWARKFSPLHPLPDAGAEIAHALLLAGIAVQACAEIRKKAVSGKFIVENQRKIRVCTDETIAIVYPYQDADRETLYKMGRKIPRSTWERGVGIVIKPCAINYREIRDYAETYGFDVRPKAAELLAAAEETANALTAAKVATVVKVEKVTVAPSASEAMAAKLAVGDVIADLRDDA